MSLEFSIVDFIMDSEFKWNISERKSFLLKYIELILNDETLYDIITRLIDFDIRKKRIL